MLQPTQLVPPRNSSTVPLTSDDLEATLLSGVDIIGHIFGLLYLLFDRMAG